MSRLNVDSRLGVCAFNNAHRQRDLKFPDLQSCSQGCDKCVCHSDAITSVTKHTHKESHKTNPQKRRRERGDGETRRRREEEKEEKKGRGGEKKKRKIRRKKKRKKEKKKKSADFKNLKTSSILAPTPTPTPLLLLLLSKSTFSSQKAFKKESH